VEQTLEGNISTGKDSAYDF